uniref:Vitellogenin receptor n=1 Tax=Palaemon carinicauda TaxID=392227 RepID=A0A171LJP1_PALCI|nr:vitellogenin receptor [Palaemon carinicauda]
MSFLVVSFVFSLYFGDAWATTYSAAGSHIRHNRSPYSIPTNLTTVHPEGASSKSISSVPCTSGEWKCSGDGMCIDKSLRCDRIPHCPDMSDELGCEDCDKLRFYRCRNGECIPKFFQCDGTIDCSDKSDELDCIDKESSCPLKQFRCKLNNLCIPKLWLCDGAPDCLDHSDEEECPTKPACREDQFRCKNGVCVSLGYVCDGEFDCKEGEDESDCEISRCKENPNHYQCKDGTCLQPEKVCDGRRDCSDGSDEGGLCSRQCKVGDCSHLCYSTPGGPHCMCSQGYRPLSDKDCADIDECQRNVSICDHFCENLPGSYKCVCGEKYNLESDNKTCVNEGFGYGFIIVAMNREIREIYLNAISYNSVFSGQDLIQCVAYDPVEDKVYWSNSIAILRKGRMTSEQPEAIVNKGIRRVESLAVDWYGRNLYVADSGIQKIIVCALSGLNCQVLLDNVNPRTLRLDIKNRLLFWTDTKRQVIMKAGMDGSKPVSLISDGIKIPNGLALDPPARRVYWMDAGHSRIEHVLYDGTDRKNLPYGAVSHPFSMDVWESRLYWSDLDHEHVRSCLKTNGKSVQMVLKGTSRNDFYGLTLYHTTMFDQGNNPCRERLCSHLCLLSPGSTAGYKCACPAEMEISTDMHSCKAKAHVAFPFVSDGDKFYMLFNPEMGTMRIERELSHLRVERVGDFVYDPRQRSVIVSDVFKKNLLRVPLESGRVHHIMDNVVAVGVSFDWLRNNVYWVDGEKKVVEVISGAGYHRNVLASGYHNPTDITVAPLQGFFFVTDAGLVPFIQRCGLEGMNCKNVVTENLYRPSSIVMDKDPEMQRIYWCDTEMGVIETAATDGTRRALLQSRLHSPISIMVSKDYLMWTLEARDNLYIASKKTNDTRAFSLKLDTADYGVRVLKLADVGWEVPVNVSLAFCQQGNGGCSHLCLGNNTHTQVCSCGLGYQLMPDGKLCSTLDCPKNFFSCHTTGECVLSSWKCDGTPDCSDRSDELNCTQQQKPCSSDQFRCSSGNCISKAWVCDGNNDCFDGSDEKLPDCQNKTCRANYYACKSGQCVPGMWRCDGFKECEDGSDEDDCPENCGEHKFTCNDGSCIPDVWHCDNGEDCRDGSDEWNCTGKVTTTTVSGLTDSSKKWTCDDDEITCEVLDGDDPVCVEESSRCDGMEQCPYGDDEKDCGCADDQFKCLYTDRCIPRRWVCNQIKDCKDGSDEDCSLNATTTIVPDSEKTTTSGWLCQPGEHPCKNGQCIKSSMLCDGSSDCNDGSDEWDHCFTNCQKYNGGCQHECHSTVDAVYCSCHRGYHLDSDGKSCLDDEECDVEETCAHLCIEMKGSYMCSCMEGYTLEPDRRTCKLTKDKEWALVAGSEGILNMTTQLQVMSRIPLEDDVSLNSFDFDPSSDSFIYADDKGFIVQMAAKADPFPGAIETVWRSSNPQGIAVDAVASNLYFSEYFVNPPSIETKAKAEDKSKRSMVETEDVYSIINMCSLKNRRCTRVYEAFNVKVPSTKVAPVEENFFFCINHQSGENQGQIMASKLDGTSPRVLHQEKVVRCGALALDLPKKRIYWTDTVLNSIQSVSWNGDGYRLVIEEGVHNPVALMLLGEKLTWSNKGGKLGQCHKYYGSYKGKLLDSGDKNKKFEGRALIAVGPPLNVKDPCLDKNCSHLCVKDKGEGKCLCENGFKVSQQDPTACIRADTCPGNPCAVGTCEMISSKRFVCRCPSGFSGMLCEVSQDPLKQSSNVGTAVAVVLIVVILVALVAGVLWYRRQPFLFWMSKRRMSNQTYRFSNPAFGVMADTRIVSSKSPVPSSCASQGTNPPFHLITGPQDGDGSGCENPFSVVEVSQINTSLDSAVVSGTDSTSYNAAFNKVDLESPIPPPNYLQEERKEWVLSPYNPLK